jgi:hypothetical protein
MAGCDPLSEWETSNAGNKMCAAITVGEPTREKCVTSSFHWTEEGTTMQEALDVRTELAPLSRIQ